MRNSVIIITYFLFLIACSKNNDLPDNTNDSPFIPRDTIDLSVSGFPNVIVPEDNPSTKAGVELGRHLFYDPNINCASCHLQEFSFSVPSNTAVDREGKTYFRNPMPLINLAWVQEFSWDGIDSHGLEQKMRSSVENSANLNYDEVITQLKNSETDYVKLYSEAFGSDEITKDRTDRALAQFLRTIQATKTRVHQFMDGDINALNSSEQLGFNLFFNETGNCFHCHLHTNKLFTDNSFRNNGIDSATSVHDFSDPGRYFESGIDFDRGKFRSTTLINIDLTAPYMHDGRFETLEEVMEHYNAGGVFSPNIDNLIDEDPKEVGLGLEEHEKQALIDFMKALTDTSVINDPKLGSPFLE